MVNKILKGYIPFKFFLGRFQIREDYLNLDFYKVKKGEERLIWA